MHEADNHKMALNRPVYHWCIARGHCVAGVLVLSEFAGAAQSLGAGAILVNPWNITDMAAAIEDALTMSDQVCVKGLRLIRSYMDPQLLCQRPACSHALDQQLPYAYEKHPHAKWPRSGSAIL